MPSGANTRSRSNGPFFSWTKSLPRPDFLYLLGGQVEAELRKGRCDRLTVSWCAFDEEIGVLGRVREAEEDGARLSDEEVPHAVARERVSDFLGLPVLKRAHTRASPVGSLRTSACTLPSSRRREMANHREPAGTS